MGQPVTNIIVGFSNSALRMPYALAQLACGHVARVVLKPARMRCVPCGAEVEKVDGMNVCACGASHFSYIYTPKPENPADRITAVGDMIECEDCATEAKQLDWLRSIDPSSVHHTRERFGGVHLYRLDQTSPSGFMLVGSVAPTKAVEDVLRSWGGGKTPLSPTEPA